MTAPIAQYLFKDNANDETGTYNGTASNVTYENLPTGVNYGGKVAVFNGSSSKIDQPNITPISGTNARSVEFWIKNSAGGIVSFAGTDSPRVYSSLISPKSTDQFWYWDIGFGNKKWASNVITTWQHIVLTFPASSTQTQSILYINGVAQSGTTATERSIDTYNDYYAIGYSRKQNSNFFNGKLANFRIYNSVLSAEEVAAHYLAEYKKAGMMQAMQMLMMQ